MPRQVTNYQCPQCTGPLHFDSASGRLVCDYCGSIYTTEQIEEHYRKKDEAAAEAFQEEMIHEDTAGAEEPVTIHEAAETGNPWDASDIESDWGAQAGRMKAYSCPSCGAELFCEETTAATRCPYCGNPSIIPGQFAGTLKPDYIIPFKLDQNAAEKALKNHYRGKFLLPGVFTNQNHIKEIRGVYVPFWLYEGEASGEATFAASRSHTYTRGNYEITETDHFQIYRSASLVFDKVPADAKRNMPDGHMDAIEPFRYQDLKEFSTAFLPGYFADKYDVTSKENIPRIEKRVKQTTLTNIRNTISGYTTVTPQSNNIRIRRGKVSYALLPVWILYTHWTNKDFLFAMNGQTGKIVGDLPVSKAKLFGLFFGLTALFTAVLSVFFI